MNSRVSGQCLYTVRVMNSRVSGQCSHTIQHSVSMYNTIHLHTQKLTSTRLIFVFPYLPVEIVEPKFSSPVKFVEVIDGHNYGKAALEYNSTTYPSDPGCPCDVFEYVITRVNDVLNPDNQQTDRVFVIDK